MSRLRRSVPFLGILALAVLFLKLPETPDLLGTMGCTTCATSDPYLPLLGAGYFAALVGLAWLFPTFPGRTLAKAGLVWAGVLAAALTWIGLPGWCLACLVAHGCNLAIWGIWVWVPADSQTSSGSTVRERVYLAAFAPLAVVALFSGLNLTFMAYGHRIHAGGGSTTSLKSGDPLPTFAVQTKVGESFSSAGTSRFAGTVLNFVSPDCQYCKEQLPILDAVATELSGGPYRFVNVSATLPAALTAHAPATEWVADPEGKLRGMFAVSGYPTLFLADPEGRIERVISGVPEELRAVLLGILVGKSR